MALLSGDFLKLVILPAPVAVIHSLVLPQRRYQLNYLPGNFNWYLPAITVAGAFFKAFTVTGL